MVQRAVKFTPQVLLSAPRRSAGVPNPAGTKILFTSSTYSFETHKKTTELRVIDSHTGESHELAKDRDISDLQWLNNDEFAYLQAGKDSTTSLLIASVTKLLQNGFEQSHYAAGKVDGPAENLKLHQLAGDAGYAVVLSAKATPSGELFNPANAKKPRSTAKLYSTLMVRHWDSWTTKEKNTLWYGKLSKRGEGKSYELSKLTNLLAGHKGIECPILPFGGTDHFDLSDKGIIFVSKDPKLNAALNTQVNVYLARIESWEGEGEPSSPHELYQAYAAGFDGAKSSPVLHRDRAAFLSMKINGYEADQNRVFVIDDVFSKSTSSARPLQATEITSSDGSAWNRSPSSVVFSHDGKNLLVLAEDQGATKVYSLSSTVNSQPQALTNSGSISDLKPLPNGSLFVSGSSLVDNSFYHILDPQKLDPQSHASEKFTSSNSSAGNKFGLKASQVSYIWTPASNPAINENVHSIVMKPSNFSSEKKYPVAYLIHGGPQGAWADSWSTRWNPAIFAEQGYIVIAPNPTGSTGYGQAFTDAIRGNWGGDPYQDIVNVFNWVGNNMPEADNEKAVMLGASYGGYMANWIQGHSLGRKFKCIVNHDGITSFAGGMYPTDELYFPFYDLGPTSWYDTNFHPSAEDQSSLAQLHRNFVHNAPPHLRSTTTSASPWTKWDPSAHFANWATPQLIIHSAKDYRLPIAEGLAAFNVLQARGVPSQFLTFPDENHWVLKPENSLVWHKVVLNWINQYAGLPAFAPEDEDSEEFYGGVIDGSSPDAAQAQEQGGAEMPAQGRPET